jgi:hypothetical protein
VDYASCAGEHVLSRSQRVPSGARNQAWYAGIARWRLAVVDLGRGLGHPAQIFVLHRVVAIT